MQEVGQRPRAGSPLCLQLSHFDAVVTTVVKSPKNFAGLEREQELFQFTIFVDMTISLNSGFGGELGSIFGILTGLCKLIALF